MTIPHIPDALLTASGLAGAAIYAVTYVLVAFDRMPSQTANFYATRLLAAVLVGVSLLQTFHLATAVIQGFFVAVSILGLVRHLGAGREAAAYRRSQGMASLPVARRAQGAVGRPVRRSGRGRVRQEPAQAFAFRAPE